MDSWQEALVHRPHSILGVRMVPFSLAHLEALTVLDHPALRGERMGWVAIEMFLAVCTADDPLSRVADLARHRRWRVRLLRRFFPSSLTWVESRIDAYLRDYFTLPAMWQPDPDEPGDAEDAPQKMPWTAKVVRTLTARYGMTHAEAWACPAGYAIHLHLTEAEAQGNKVPVMTDDDRDLLAALESADHG